MSDKGMVRETITVVAKTYPECSKKYGCLVCTAGINEKGEWRRLYPIPWLLFSHQHSLRFRKWDIISVPTKKKKQDPRRESYWVDPYTIEQDLKVIRGLKGWEEKLQLLEPHLDDNMEILWESDRSLGLVKPKVIHDFLEKERHKLTEPDEMLTLERTEQAQQQLLPDFEPDLMTESRNPPEALPWLGYKFTCYGPNCHGHEMMCIDWEIQALYRREGFAPTRQKAIRWMNERDLYFVVGTTWRFGTWLIIGLVYPPKELQRSLIL